MNEIKMEGLKQYIAKNRSLDADEEIRSLITRLDPDIDVEPMFQNSLYVNPQATKVKPKLRWSIREIYVRSQR